jgi:hypothetical protein
MWPPIDKPQMTQMIRWHAEMAHRHDAVTLARLNDV